MRRNIRWHLVAVASVGLTVTACTGSTAGHDSTAPSPTAVTRPAAPLPDGMATVPAVPEGDGPEPLASPTDDPQARRAAVSLAQKTMAAFARPGSSEARWWADLSPLLSNRARQLYAGTDPANVPARQVTGRGQLLPSSSAYLAQVRVPTDVGPYEVLMSRAGQTAPWTVERLTPPAGLR